MLKHLPRTSELLIWMMLLLVLNSHLVIAQNQVEANYNIIPQPISVLPSKGEFVVDAHTLVRFNHNQPELKKIATYFTNRFAKSTGILLKHNNKSLHNKQIRLVLLPASKLDTGINKVEGSYFLTVSPTEVRIAASKPIGIFYGLQTVWQLFPTEIDKADHHQQKWIIPCVKIMDSPRFKWRGLHLDVSRHFFNKEEVKQYLDFLASYKFNIFHWHLTDDQGWRIEIKKFPKLTSVGSVRSETMLGHTRDKDIHFDGTPHKGFYTQKEIAEIVAYASARYITVVPEIEMPGHAQAAVSAYPELGCADTPSVMRKWGISPYIFNTEDKTFDFLEKVLDEVITLFPGKYIHIGGDEAIKQQWKASSKIQAHIKALGLKDEDELQSYFIKRIEKYLNNKGKLIIGWDEILDGGLAPNAAVMSWRGIDGGREAAKAGHPVVMTPTSYCYLDFYQNNPETESKCIGGLTTLKKVYSYEPAPDEFGEAAQKLVLGVQGNVWTEYMANFGRVQEQIFPRMFALAEVGWSDRSRLNWGSFRTRVASNAQRLDFQNIKHGHIPAE